MKRRDFLRNTIGSTLACSSSAALFTQLGMMNAALASTCSGYSPVSDYKALVCIFLLGGNDSYNLLIPSDSSRYNTYIQSRGHQADGGVGIEKADLVSITEKIPLVGGQSYGIHPSAPELAALFNAGNLAFVANTGTLIQPTNKMQYNSGSYPLPPQLFSHSDQQGQWQYGQPTQNGIVGWGGLVADRLSVLNPGMKIPMSLSLGGQNRFQAGQTIQPYTVTPNGPAQLQNYSGQAGTSRMSALMDLLNQTYADPLSRTYANTMHNSIDWYNALSTALDGATDVSSYFPAPGSNPVADALQEIAKIISVQSALGAKRQIFYLGFGSFDTHDGQLDDGTGQPYLFSTISQAMNSFYNATKFLGQDKAVTTFTLSEFARTLNSNGDGTDHAWGGIQLAVGGAVKGQTIYGAPCASGSVFPNQTLNGQDCLARGQMVPSVSVDQYSATLAKWLGVNSCDIDTIFPFVHNFPTADLGFLT
ncbi:MAG: DUF1501 domain-containing protein [Rudaea sp.]